MEVFDGYEIPASRWVEGVEAVVGSIDLWSSLTVGTATLPELSEDVQSEAAEEAAEVVVVVVVVVEAVVVEARW